MSVPVVFRRQAKQDLDEAVGWYEEIRLGLGYEFLARVQDALNRIASNPVVHGTVHKDVRCALVRRFPYAIYYRLRRNQAVILWVFHHKRDPQNWQRRT